MHTDLPESLAGRTNAQGIIKVLGILRVNRTSKDITEVFPALDLLLGDACLYLLCGILDSLRIFVRQSVLGEDGMHLHIIVTFLTEHVNHLTHYVLRLLRGPLRDFDDSFVASLATFQFLLRNQDIMHEDIPFGNEEGKVFLHLQLTHCLVHLM